MPNILNKIANNLRKLAEESSLPLGFEGFDSYTSEPTESSTDKATSWLSKFKVGDTLIVKSYTFRVEKVCGISVYITKGKGEKLYTLHTISINPFIVEIREVNGSGDIKYDKAPIATIKPFK